MAFPGPSRTRTRGGSRGQVAIRLDRDTLTYFKKLADEAGASLSNADQYVPARLRGPAKETAARMAISRILTAGRSNSS